jgi:dsRNA-specific ribonuclease
MADVFEAIVASIYIDSNCDLSYTWSCILPIFKPVFDLLSPNQQLTNPTRLFRERVKQLGIDYNEISYDFVEGNELVLCNVFVRGQQVGSGQGNSRKYAKRRASQFGTEWLLSHSHLLFDKESEGYL